MVSVKNGSGEPDSFRLLRLCLLRPPPSWIQAGPSACSVDIELAVGVTDDYGGHLEFDTLDLQIELVSSSHDALIPVPSVRLDLKSHTATTSDHRTQFTVNGSRGAFHTLKITLSFLSSDRPKTGTMRFVLSAAPNSVAKPSLGLVATKMLEIIGGADQQPFDSWDGNRNVLMSVMSGDIEVRTTPSKGKAPVEGKASTSKVQTAFRTVHLSSSSSPTFKPITILERAGLNNSTGQRLWDCALGLSCYLSLHPSSLLPPSSTSSLEPPRKRSRIDDTSRLPLQVLELGAGCALVGLTAHRILKLSFTDLDTDILFTDVEVTVDTTLKENLDLNLASTSTRSQVLDWGPLSPSDLDRVWGRRKGPFDLTILGSDILYNPSSHSILLESLVELLKPREGSSNQALIAYKARTEGDDAFFGMASEVGLKVEMVWEWGVVKVYRFQCK